MQHEGPMQRYLIPNDEMGEAAACTPSPAGADQGREVAPSPQGICARCTADLACLAVAQAIGVLVLRRACNQSELQYRASEASKLKSVEQSSSTM